ncbi:uncharacterized protein MELLADRAFT_37939 [Melampsora larici-populina 98AG31]|uniref:S1 motif domain-containing protein n=1 Tax=Melampsora larici-populina (strain 98AG31 / pathotype 3-4-7) TaxID=747676 RepID=F4RVF4_MELLP|nr:uncharacterized protein MELLADRAFT_37939 [Melampsora larici-populina 98AG31]EGG03681.1 hypothetical protein MELLADRAFT_37939 [Melampsora larici-populina 98AG31]
MSTTESPSSRSIVVPGQAFAQTTDNQKSISATYQPGPGVFSRDGKLYASTAGYAKREGGVIHSPQTVSVVRPTRLARVPVVGTIVTGLVTKLNKLQASLAIITVEDVPLPVGQDFPGVIRAQDVRQVDKDKVKIWTCFRPGDIVRAEVISFPTGSTGYLLATFRNELGVVFAQNTRTGNLMKALSWEEMIDEETGEREPRKVAGPA